MTIEQIVVALTEMKSAEVKQLVALLNSVDPLTASILKGELNSFFHNAHNPVDLSPN
jgi:hypothetical protein